MNPKILTALKMNLQQAITNANNLNYTVKGGYDKLVAWKESLNFILDDVILEIQNAMNEGEE